MKLVEQVVFRRLTDADFFNINKPKGSEERGGGQSYIDFPTTAITPKDWEHFFKGHKTLVTHSGPRWQFPIHSIGVNKEQFAEIGQRRNASFSIRRQKLGTRESNRVWAWHPNHGFPKPKDPNSRTGPKNLVIYIARTVEGEHWAGWFMRASPDSNWKVGAALLKMFDETDGAVYFGSPVPFDETNPVWPFGVSAKETVNPKPLPVKASATPSESKKIAQMRKERSEEELIDDLFAQDESIDVTPVTKEVIQKLVKRNAKAVKTLKELYKGKCQVTGDQFTFVKANGELYSEAHHLVPLGKGGADSPYNLIIVSPLVHRMLHYAKVEGIDIGSIKDQQLAITINGTPFTIRWHPKHAQLVNDAAAKVSAV